MYENIKKELFMMKKKLIKMQQQIEEEDEITIEEGINLFYKRCTIMNLRPATIKHYKDIINYSFFAFIYKNDALNTITQEVINNYVVFLQNKGIKTTSINTNLRAIKTVLNYLQEEGYLKNKIKIKKIIIDDVDDEKNKTYSDAEIEKLLIKPNLKKCNFTEYRDWTITCLCVATGIRCSTVINIEKTDIDYVNGILYCRHTKNRKGQKIFLNETILKILMSYTKVLPDTEKYLFPNSYGGKLLARSLTHSLAFYNKRRGVETTGIHKLRHYFAKKSILNGVDIFTLKTQLGHSNINILQDYVQILKEDIKKNEKNNPLDQMLNKNKKYIKMK